MFNMNEIITKKRDGEKLSREEIQYFVEGYTNGEIPDYQAAALLMAIFFQKMDEEETLALTEVMRDSGDIVDLSAIKGIKVDKHSTGGVGDKITLIIGPIVAACGVPVAKMSGRGLGFTGGTIDKLESIPGFRTTLDPGDFYKQVEEIGISLIGQSGHIAPADKKLYALRDVTSTVANLSLITSSIMSKKLAAGSDAILLDVKCGKGAFMEDEEDAAELATAMCKIGNLAGKKTVAVLTDMNQPLGHAVGNALEVMEAIDTLKGKGPEDVTELSLYLAAWMVYIGGKAASPEEGRRLAEEALSSGKALDVMRKLIAAQGGNPEVVDDYSLFPQAKCKEDLILTEEMLAAYSAGLAQGSDSGDLPNAAEAELFVAEIDNQQVGSCSQYTGAGRATKEESIDPSAGVIVHKKIGDRVAIGDTLATFYGNDLSKIEKVIQEAQDIYTFSTERVDPPKLIKKVIE